MLARKAEMEKKQRSVAISIAFFQRKCSNDRRSKSNNGIESLILFLHYNKKQIYVEMIGGNFSESWLIASFSLSKLRSKIDDYGII